MSFVIPSINGDTMKIRVLAHLLPFVTLMILLPIMASGADQPGAFDREALHQQQLVGLDLAARNLVVGKSSPVSAATTDIPEFRLSLSGTPAKFDQDNAVLAQLTTKQWLVAWDDNRQGSRKIYWQMYDTLFAPLTINTLAAGSSAGADFVDPKLAVDTLNRIFLFYRDRTNGMIFGARYNPALGLDIGPFLVNDTSAESFAGPFDMAVFPDGQVVVVWENYAASGSSIEMRLYGTSGASQLGPVTVNTDGGSAQHWVPSVAAAPGSGFVVAWEDYRNGQADIYCRQYTGAGTAVASDFSLVPAPSDAADQYAPDITYSTKDRYIIGWVDMRIGQEVYLQRFSQISGLVGSNIIISSDDAMIINWDVNLTTSSTGRTLATWADFGASSHILGLRLDSGLTVVGAPEGLNGSTTGRRWNPSAKFDSAGRVDLAWTEFINENADIRLAQFNSLLSPLLSEEIVCNDETIGAHSLDPYYLASSPTRHVVLWVDRRRDAGDIFLRTVSVAGMPYSREYRLNDDVGYSLQSEPSAAASDTRVLAVWIDSRSLSGVSGQRIYGRYTELNGVPIGNEFLISDSAEADIKASPCVAIAPGGQTLVAWIDQRTGTPQVWGRWLTSGGALDGDEFRISSGGVLSAADLYAGVDNSGHFGTAWLDVGESSPLLYAQWYNSDKSAADDFFWGSSVSGVSIDKLSADFASDGSLTAFWAGRSPGRSEGYLTKFAFDGSVTHAATKITDDTTAAVETPAVSVSENGDVCMAWVDHRSGQPLVYYQILTPGLAPVGNNTALSIATPEFMQQPSTDARLGRAWFAWSDPREEGMNIYCAGLTYDATGVEDEPGSLLPAGFSLAQNYPNPFNPSTVISFELPTQCKIRLAVYNLLGQHVVTLAEGAFSAGEHYVTWAGTDKSDDRVASGVYFYRLETEGFSDTRKMLLLK